ncbi:MAG: CoB--CoM heterodisulfide reductase iron-sulfur subunit B family protein [Desulfobacterales bacterium]|nr:CoB--CoM heterodisulfide reductase iron-sulfur subunit B family protein [Desulfobacterales bacterium]
MNYLYYPGCSLDGSAREYDISTRALMETLGATLHDIEDWTCCGASAAEATSALLALALPARNLALAEKMGHREDILVPCSACYLNLKTVTEKIADPEISKKIHAVLAEESLELNGSLRVRHLLDVLVNDIGPQMLNERVQRRLEGLVIAPYYGCQCLRPYPVFDDPEQPRSMEPLLEAVGATVHSWDMGGKCCGASHMNTKMEVGLELVGAILEAASGADAIVTVCPMCQMNLEAYQNKISSLRGKDLHMTILYLPQLLGLALGLPPEALRCDLNLAVEKGFEKKIA